MPLTADPPAAVTLDDVRAAARTLDGVAVRTPLVEVPALSDLAGVPVALKEVIPDDELMMITRHGVIIRLPVDGIRVIGRNTQGVKVMNLDQGDTGVDVARVVKEDEGGAEDAAGGDEVAPTAAADE